MSFLCENLSQKKKNCIVAAVAAIFFFGGWWIIIDLEAAYSGLLFMKPVYHVPGVFATVSFFVVNTVPYENNFDPYSFESKLCNPGMWMLYLFLGLMIAFSSLIGAAYILVNDFLLQPNLCQWPGYAVLLQTLSIFVANMMLKFGVTQETF